MFFIHICKMKIGCELQKNSSTTGTFSLFQINVSHKEVWLPSLPQFWSIILHFISSVKFLFCCLSFYLFFFFLLKTNNIGDFKSSALLINAYLDWIFFLVESFLIRSPASVSASTWWHTSTWLMVGRLEDLTLHIL